MANRPTIRLLLIAALAVVATAGAVPNSGCVYAHGSSPSCRSVCLTTYNQCRLATKGSTVCDVEYQACLQGCIASR